MPSEKLIDLLLAYIGERADKITEIGQLTNAEWEALLRFAMIQGVAPLLYHRLSNAWPVDTQVPEGVLDGLRDLYHRNAFQNAQYYQELSDILKRLQRGGIDVIVLKGAFLTKTVYKTEALRVIGDIDLLVKAADLGQVEKILLEMGYGPTERPSIQAQCARSQHLKPFIKKGAFPIEIHWTLYFKQDCPFEIMVDMLWEQPKPFTVVDVQVLSLSPENLLLHLCIHAYVNGFVGMRFLSDIYNTLRYYQDEIDWDDLFQRARQWKAEKVVYIALYLAKDWLAARVPEKVLAQFKPDDFNLGLVAKTIHVIAENINPKFGQNLAPLWRPNKPFRQKLSILLQRIFPPLDELAYIYNVPENSLRVYFYYPVRLKDTLIKYSGIAWRILRGDKEMQAVMTQENRIAMLRDWMKSN